MCVEIGLGVSEANEHQLASMSQIMVTEGGLTIHADHADGSVHPQFVRDAFSTLNALGEDCIGPRDIHLYLRELDKALFAVDRFADEIQGHRSVHLALEAVDDIKAALAICHRSRSRHLNFIPTIQTDPFNIEKVNMLNALIKSDDITHVSILMPSNRFQPHEAGKAVVDLYAILLNHQQSGLPKLSLDRNCSPARVASVASVVTIASVICGTFLWSAPDTLLAINQLRRSASQGDVSGAN